MTMTRPAREQAIANMNADDDRRVAAAQEARARPSALANMANRLNISQQQLMATLKSTVFKNATNDEFAALVVVADAYRLNPLLKEIYAFPVKGGGIAPMVSIDGWIKITNDHPQFDGIEFKDMSDAQGKLYAIEATIHRKDRQRPTQIIEYLEECKRNTDPWNKSPARMLRHRALMQCARYAFGFSGLGVEDDGDFYSAPVTPTMRDVTPPTRAEVAALSAGETVDQDGVVQDGTGGTEHVDTQPALADQAVENEETELTDNQVMRGVADSLIERIGRAETVIAVKNLKATTPAEMPEEMAAEVEKAAADRDAELRKPR